MKVFIGSLVKYRRAHDWIRLSFFTLRRRARASAR
jgi:hypothetical protein